MEYYLYICIMEKQLKQFDNQYSVTDTGIVYSLKGNKKELIGKISNSGYREVVINHKWKKKYLLVHRLVAENFIYNEFKARTVNHKDGNKLNNNLSNLEWCTAKENTLHAIKAGLIDTSNNYLGKYNAKLNEKEVKEIRLRLIEKQKQRDIAKQYNVSENVISTIKHNTRYRGIGLI